MNWNYSFKHWLTTLLLAPFLPTLYELFFNSIEGQVVGLLEVYPVTFLFSLFFSVPTFIIHYLVFLYLIRRQTNPALTKAILISLTIIGIVTTVLLIGGSLSMTLIYSYSISTIITGILLRITYKAKTTENFKVTL